MLNLSKGPLRIDLGGGEWMELMAARSGDGFVYKVTSNLRQVTPDDDLEPDDRIWAHQMDAFEGTVLAFAASDLPELPHGAFAAAVRVAYNAMGNQ